MIGRDNRWKKPKEEVDFYKVDISSASVKDCFEQTLWQKLLQ